MSLAKRLSEHKGYISSMFPTKGTGIYFNQRGHSVSDVRQVMKATRKKENDNSLTNVIHTIKELTECLSRL